MDSRQASLYWALAGALVGIGGFLLYSLGVPLLLIGLGLLAYGVGRRLRLDYVWATLVTLGLVPAGLVAFDYLATRPPAAGITGGLLFTELLFLAIGLAGCVLERITARRAR